MAETVKKSTTTAKKTSTSKEKTAKKTSTRKATTARKASASKAATTKKTSTRAKKSTTKKATARKPTAKALLAKASIISNIEFQGRSITDKELAEKAVKDYVAKTGNRTLKKLELFVQPENGVAYYAVDGEGGDQFQINI